MSLSDSSLFSKIKLRANAEELAGSFPALLIKAEQIAATIDVGQHGRKRAGTGEDFWQFKPYSTGDETSEIDWRQSAKRGEIFIRQKEQESSETAWFWINQDDTMHFQSSLAAYNKIEYANLLTLVLCILLNRADENFGILGEMETAGHGLSHLEKVAHTLPSARDKAPSQAGESTHAKAKSKFLLISDFLLDIAKLQKEISAISSEKSDGIIIHLADPAEVDLPYSAECIFRICKAGLPQSLSR